MEPSRAHARTYRTEIRDDANNTAIQWLNAHRQPLGIRADSEIRDALCDLQPKPIAI
jgi:hypothetical protein